MFPWHYVSVPLSLSTTKPSELLGFVDAHGLVKTKPDDPDGKRTIPKNRGKFKFFRNGSHAGSHKIGF